MDRLTKTSTAGFTVAGVGLIGLIATMLQAVDIILKAINLEALPAEWVAPVSFLALIIGGLVGLMNLGDGEAEPADDPHGVGACVEATRKGKDEQ
jgi:hypothetical protein